MNEWVKLAAQKADKTEARGCQAVPILKTLSSAAQADEGIDIKGLGACWAAYFFRNRLFSF